MRYPLSPRASLENSNLNSPQQSGGGRVSSLRSAWENGLSPVNKVSSPKRTQTVLPSAVRSQEKLRATQKQQQKSWRSSIGSGQENTSTSSPVPAWRSTAGKERSPVKHSSGGQENTPAWRSTPPSASGKQHGWRSSPSPYTKHEVGRSSGPSLNKPPQKVASPVVRSPIPHLSSPGRLARDKSNDYIRKWNTIGSPGTPEVYYRSEKETIGSSCHATTEVYESKADKLSSSDHYLSGSPFNDDDIPNIKRTETADSPAMNKLRLDLDMMCSSNHTAPKEEEEEEKHQHQTFVDETYKKEEEVEEDASVHIGGQSVTTSGSSLVYSLEDTILGSQANSRKSKELIDVVERSLQQIALSSGSASVSTDDSTDNGSSNQLFASELIASTLAECRLLLQMSPPPTPVAINSIAERNTDKKVDISARFDSDRAIKEAPSAESDCSIDKLMRCPCCSQKFNESGNHAPLHSFACEHIVCKDCVFQSTRHSNSVRCPECGEKGAFDKTRPVVSKSYLRLIKKMGGTGSEKTKERPNKEEDEIMSIPSQIRCNGGIDSDAISLFSSVSGHAHTAKLAAHNKELTKLIDEDYVSVPSSTSRHESDKSVFTINPKREDVLSNLSESHCYDGSHREEKSLISEFYCCATSSKSQHQMSANGDEELSKTSVKSPGLQQDLGIVPPRVDEISPMPPQEPATPVSRAEFRFLQRKQKLAESLEKVNRILEKSKNKEMGKISEEASISSSRHSSSSVKERSIVVQEEVISNSAASSAVDESIASARDLQSEELVMVDHDEVKSVTASVQAISNISAENPTKKSIKKSEFDTTKADVTLYDDIEDELRDMEDDLKAKLNKKSTKERLKTELRVYTGPQPSPLPQNAVEVEEQDTDESESCDTFDHFRSKAELTVCTGPQPSPLPQKATEKVQSGKKASPCESAKSNEFCFDPFTFGETPKAFEGNNVFRSDDVPVVEFDDFFRVTSSEDSSVKEHEGAFLIPQPQQKDKKHKAQSSSNIQKLTDANRCAQFLPSLDFSKHGFNSYDSPSARSASKSGKSTNKKVKKKMQQYSNAKPKRLSQKVFKSFSRDADELSVTSGLSSRNKGVNGNQEWRFQETLPNPPSVGVKPTQEKETPSYAFSEASCSLSPSSDTADMKGSLDALVTHKKGFHLKIRNKMRKKKH